MGEVDERYKRGMIYTIRCYSDDTIIYVGSTINTLIKRFDGHKKSCKAGVSGISLYKHIENNDWSDWYIELYEIYPCNNKMELNRREGEVIREIGTINKNIAGRTHKEYKKEYYEQNADKIKEKSKEYYEQNADKYKEYNKEYREQNADKNKEYFKEYREQNKEKISLYKREKICCDICGTFSLKHNLPRHQKTKNCM